MGEETLRIAAGDAGFEERIRQLSGNVQGRIRYHTIQLPDGRVLPGLQSVEHLRWRLGLFGLPEDLRGCRVLDIGAWDGWFSFECERRGAKVVAVDCVELDTFLEARALLASQVEYLTLDVNELSARTLGRFDIVLFFGVLYHLRHPLLGLEKALELSTDRVLIESFVIPSESRSIPAVMEFYERGELGGQIDNWCGPSPECLLAMCRSAGFAQAELLDVTNGRASVMCRRHWAATVGESGATPHLHSVVNNRNYGAIFHPLKDEYLCCYFRFPADELSLNGVRLEVDGFGVPALTVTANGQGAWQANCVRPAGLETGRHGVRLRIGSSALSNRVEFLVTDETGNLRFEPRQGLPTGGPDLCSAEYHPSGDLRLAKNRAGTLVCYFRSNAEFIGIPDVEVDAGGSCLYPQTVGSLGENVWQVNILLDQPLQNEATARLRLATGDWSQRCEVTRPNRY